MSQVTLEKVESFSKDELSKIKKINKKPIYKDKFYIIEVEGLPYGSITRKATDYSDALKIYREVKKTLNILKCEVKLNKYTVNEYDEIVCTTVHRKLIGQEYDIKHKLNQIKEILTEIDTMKKIYTSTHSESDKFLSAVYHTIETVNAEDLTEQEMRTIFRKMENKCTLRRASKDQIDYLQVLQPNLNQISANVNKALEVYKTKEYNSKTQKAKQNSENKTMQYRELIGLEAI